MGISKVAIRVGDPQGQRYESLEALVDTGASYTVVPASCLEHLNIPRSEKWPFELADGRVIERDIGYAVVQVDGRSTLTIVVFGDEDAGVLLGAYTLEGVRMAPDPVRRRLIPVPGLLMRSLHKT
ncbi:MAG: retroviral-like aspartic protease family protein [Chloroflexi bacterium]|nr:retroviral-like aspartic protease family protein [Chloroflexota bacterium]